MQTESAKSYDWLCDALVATCRKVFPLESTLRVHSIREIHNRSRSHHDFLFSLVSADAEFRMQLRLHRGFFSLWSGTEDMKTAKEYTIMRHAYQHGYPAPFPYFFSPTIRPFGFPFILMDEGDGELIKEMPNSHTVVKESLVDSLAVQLAKLHTSVATGHPWIPIVDVKTVVKLLESKVRNLQNRELSSCLQGCRRQMEKMTYLHPVSLHGQYDLDHTLIHHHAVRSVINWEHTAVGDPRWDVAHTSLALQRDFDRSFSNRFLARYVQLFGAPMKELNFWEGLIAFRAFALSGWLRSLDERSFSTVTGLGTDLFDHEEFYRTCALKQFGE